MNFSYIKTFRFYFYFSQICQHLFSDIFKCHESGRKSAADDAAGSQMFNGAEAAAKLQKYIYKPFRRCCTRPLIREICFFRIEDDRA